MTIARFILVAALTSAAPWAQAEETAATPPGLAEEVSALRQQVGQQAKELEALKQAVARLSAPPASQPSVGVETSTAPAPVAAAPASKTPASPDQPSTAEAPRAEAVATTSGPQHTVAKGETLTSIAKHYNVSIVDLQKVNKITDERKLQIGQTLLIPQKTTAHPTDKKETP